MLGVVLAVVARVAYGVSDVISGSAVRRHSTASVALWSQLTGLVLLGLVALVVRPALDRPVLGWGLAAGALAAVALLLFYTALQRGRTAVVAPVAGSGVVVPVVAGVLGGEPLAWPVALGVAAVVVGVLVVGATGDGDGTDVSGSPDPADRPHRRLIRSSPARAHPVPVDDRCVPEHDASPTRSSVVLATLAAAGFGTFFVLLDLATAAAGGHGAVGPVLAVALAVQAGALAVTLVAAVGHIRACLAPRPRLLLAARAVGLVDVVGDLALVVAVGDRTARGRRTAGLARPGRVGADRRRGARGAATRSAGDRHRRRTGRRPPGGNGLARGNRAVTVARRSGVRPCQKSPRSRQPRRKGSTSTAGSAGWSSRRPAEELQMAKVIMQAVVSVDGYIAYPDDSVGPLFDWYGNGDTELSAGSSGWTFHVSRASAEYVQPFWDAVTVTVIGRHLFDTTNGWDGKPAAGDELVVVTHRPLPEEWLADHPDAPFHTAGSVEAGIALAKELAGDGLVCVTAGDLGGQAFSAGLVDEIAMDVAPVVLGEGVRFFGGHVGTVLLDDPDRVVQGDRVLHLRYTVRR